METKPQNTADATGTLAALKCVIRMSPDERRALLRILRDDLPELWAEISREEK
jgi:hypothetical protein